MAQPAPPANGEYTAHDIAILEGLEPMRCRPGMFIGGTDQRALHHLLAELIDNSMDEAVAGHASRIETALHDDGSASVRDNGRGIPVDPHPKYENVSALQMILTTLHSGGKFGDNNKVYATTGGMHGVGLSAVNALSNALTVEVARDNLLAHAGKQGRRFLSAFVATAFAQDYAEAASAGFRPSPFRCA